MKKTYEITISHSGEVIILVDDLSVDRIHKETFHTASPEQLQRCVVKLFKRYVKVLPKHNKQDPSNFAFKRWQDMLDSVEGFSLTAASQLFYDNNEVVWMIGCRKTPTCSLIDSDSFVKVKEV